LAGLVSGYIQHFTYVGLFIVLLLCGLGLPVPEDIALLVGGFLVHRGITQYPITLAVSFVGVVAGDNSLFLLGRRFGSGVLRYFVLVQPHAQSSIARLKAFMRRHGHRTIFYARFLAGVRALVYLTAGSVGVTPRQFFVYDALGAVISVPIVVSIGCFFGPQLELAIAYVGGFERMALIAAAACIVFYGSLSLMRTADNHGDAA
jgi:membrane protein DedA with SNARE-associated domain